MAGEDVLLAEFREVAESLRSTYGYSFQDLIALLAGGVVIPISVFATSMSPLRAIVTYLHRNKEMPLRDIAEYLQRGYQAVWAACQEESIVIEEAEYVVPLAVFSDELSILETVVAHLHELYALGFTVIAHVLHRDPRTIWTVYARAKKKRRIQLSTRSS